MKYKIVEAQHSHQIARLAVALTNEIIERTGTKHFDVDIPLAEVLCKQFIEQGQYTVIAAFSEEEIVGFGALCESHSLYAEGAFGIIQECYVVPQWRSRSVGHELIQHIVRFGKERGWKRLELCTPPLPEFDNTVAFYLDNGFEVTGGFKMKMTF